MDPSCHTSNVPEGRPTRRARKLYCLDRGLLAIARDAHELFGRARTLGGNVDALLQSVLDAAPALEQEWEVLEVMDVDEGSRNRTASPARTVLPVPCYRRLQTTHAVRHSLKIVGDAVDDSPTVVAVPELRGLVLNEVHVMHLDVAERRRRCQVVSSILLRLAAYDGTWAEHEAA